MDTRTLDEAITARYSDGLEAGVGLSTDELVTRLLELQAGGVDSETLLGALDGLVLQPLDHAIIALLDARITREISTAGVPDDVARRLRGIVSAAARLALVDGILPMTRSPIIPIVDAAMALSFGWSDLAGKPLENSDQKLDEAMQGLQVATATISPDPGLQKAQNKLLELLEGDIVRFVSAERDRIHKLEQRLADAAMGQLTAERSRGVAARCLNEAMAGKQLPAEVIRFLQGVWFDSLQLIATRNGSESQEWQRARQLTDTLIATLQPEPGNLETPEADTDLDEMLAEVAADVQLEDVDIDVALEVDLSTEPDEADAALSSDPEPTPEEAAYPEHVHGNQQLYRIIENLPDELRDTLVSIEHDAEAITKALEAIESAHVLVLRGEALDCVDFTPLPEGPGQEAQTAQALMGPVEKLERGAWFLFQDDAGHRHFKLTLKDPESQHLIFTNRNGGSALHSNYEEFAYLLSSGRVRQLPRPGDLLKNLRRDLMDILKQKVKGDQLAELRRQREVRESMAQAIENTRFLVVAVPRSVLNEDAPPTLEVDVESLHDRADSGELLFVDQTGTGMQAPDMEELVKLIRGDAIELEDEMPVGMEEFRTRVSELRDRPALKELPGVT